MLFSGMESVSFSVDEGCRNPHELVRLMIDCGRETHGFRSVEIQEVGEYRDETLVAACFWSNKICHPVGTPARLTLVGDIFIVVGAPRPTSGNCVCPIPFVCRSLFYILVVTFVRLVFVQGVWGFEWEGA